MNDISRISDMFSLTLEKSEATYLSHGTMTARRERIKTAYSPDGLSSLKEKVDEYISGRRELKALEFYLAFEQVSALLLFHAFPRPGERNLHANGLQQTYGDHIRLMMLGFDKFEQSDIDWLMKRRWRDPIDVGQAELEECLRQYHDLELNRSERVAIWLASALHDYGKIFRRGYGLDAEDAVPLCDNLIEALSPEGMSELVQYGIRNHDLIEHTVTGDTSARFIKQPIGKLSQGAGKRAMTMLGLIQLIGAASLGEGRVTKAKVAIYNGCLNGDIVADESVEARLGRLLFGREAVPVPSATARAAEALSGLDDTDRSILKAILTRTPILGWNNFRDCIVHEEHDEESKALPRLVRTLIMVGKIWRERAAPPTHIVLARPHELAKCTRADGDVGARLKNEDAATELLNGASALILR